MYLYREISAGEERLLHSSNKCTVQGQDNGLSRQPLVTPGSRRYSTCVSGHPGGLPYRALLQEGTTGPFQ